MSDDLISRKSLMQSLRNNVLIDVTPNLEQAIAKQSTAYDVDKVVERLEELSTKIVTADSDAVPVFDSDTGSFQGFTKTYEIEKEFIDKDKAMKIVKSGGIG